MEEDGWMIAYGQRQACTRCETADEIIWDEWEQLQALGCRNSPELFQRLRQAIQAPITSLITTPAPELSEHAIATENMMEVQVSFPQIDTRQTFRLAESATLAACLDAVKAKAATTHNETLLRHQLDLVVCLKGADHPLPLRLTMADICWMHRRLWASRLHFEIHWPVEARSMSSAPRISSSRPSFVLETVFHRWAVPESQQAAFLTLLGRPVEAVEHVRWGEGLAAAIALHISVTPCPDPAAPQNAVTHYAVSVTVGSTNWTANHTFRDCHRLFLLLCPVTGDTDFPKRTPRGLSRKQLLARASRIEEWLRRTVVLRITNSELQAELINFLEIPKHCHMLEIVLAAASLRPITPASPTQRQSIVRCLADGVLCKRAIRKGNNYRWRYFELFSDGALYYSRRKGEERRGVIRVTADHFVSDCTLRKFGFAISDVSNTYHLAAPSVEDKMFWMHLIKGLVSKFRVRRLSDMRLHLSLERGTAVQLAQALLSHAATDPPEGNGPGDSESTDSTSRKEKPWERTVREAVELVRAESKQVLGGSDQGSDESGAEQQVTTPDITQDISQALLEDYEDGDIITDLRESGPNMLLQVPTTQPPVNSDSDGASMESDFVQTPGRSVRRSSVLELPGRATIRDASRRASRRASLVLLTAFPGEDLDAEEGSGDERGPVETAGVQSHTHETCEEDAGQEKEMPKLSGRRSGRDSRFQQLEHWRIECERLVADIKRYGSQGSNGLVSIRFGDLFLVRPEFLVGKLRQARVRGLVDFKGEMLWFGVHDETKISLTPKAG